MNKEKLNYYRFRDILLRTYMKLYYFDTLSLTLKRLYCRLLATGFCSPLVVYIIVNIDVATDAIDMHDRRIIGTIIESRVISIPGRSISFIAFRPIQPFRLNDCKFVTGHQIVSTYFAS